jgi:hypothetical protein
VLPLGVPGGGAADGFALGPSSALQASLSWGCFREAASADRFLPRLGYRPLLGEVRYRSVAKLPAHYQGPGHELPALHQGLRLIRENPE